MNKKFYRAYFEFAFWSLILCSCAEQSEPTTVKTEDEICIERIKHLDSVINISLEIRTLQNSIPILGKWMI